MWSDERLVGAQRLDPCVRARDVLGHVAQLAERVHPIAMHDRLGPAAVGESRSAPAARGRTTDDIILELTKPPFVGHAGRAFPASRPALYAVRPSPQIGFPSPPWARPPGSMEPIIDRRNPTAPSANCQATKYAKRRTTVCARRTGRLGGEARSPWRGRSHRASAAQIERAQATLVGTQRKLEEGVRRAQLQRDRLVAQALADGVSATDIARTLGSRDPPCTAWSGAPRRRRRDEIAPREARGPA